MNDVQDLPPGWCIASLGDVVDIHDSRRVPVNAEERAARPGPYPYYGANGQVGTIDDYLFDGDFVLVAEDGGYFDDPSRGVAYRATGQFWVNNHAHILAPRGGIPVQFMIHALNGVNWMAYVSGTTRPKLTQGAMVRVPIRLPPLKEQERILGKLDAARARSRRAREALDEVPALLEKLRQSILAAAFRGDLTKDWRAKNPDVEPAEKLLQRIRAERRKKWEEAELAKMQAKGKPPTDDRWKQKYREPEPADTAGLAELPSGWCWASLDELTFLVGGITKGQQRRGTASLRAVPYLRVANVQRGRLDLGEMKEIEATSDEIEELRLQPGDILLNEGGDRDKLGRGWVWEGQLEECIHQNHVFRARPVSSALQPKLISHYANLFGQVFFVDQGKQTTNLASVSMSRVRRLPVVLPPAAEQQQILARIDRQLDATTRIVGQVEPASRDLVNLDRMILSTAFRGELVPQDPSDEPADVMLARLKASASSPTSSPGSSPTSGKRRGRPRKP